MKTNLITNIRFENFRGFRTATFDNLSRVTLISGRNNSGKSSALEGIFLFLNHVTPKSFEDINIFRALPAINEPSAMWEPAFYNFNTDRSIIITAKIGGSDHKLEYSKDTSFIPSGDHPMIGQYIHSARTSYTLKLHFTHGAYEENAHFTIGQNGVMFNLNTSLENNQIELLPHVQFINSHIANFDGTVIEWFSKLELSGAKPQIVEALTAIEPEAEDVTTIVQNGHIQLYIKKTGRLLPLKLAGDGMNRLMYILLAIIANPNSVILIDEIETGFHHSMYGMLWETIARAADKCRCQIIATTHSYECIMAAPAGVPDAEDDGNFCFYRLARDAEDNVIAHRFSADMLRTAATTNWEVR